MRSAILAKFLFTPFALLCITVSSGIAQQLFGPGAPQVNMPSFPKVTSGPARFAPAVRPPIVIWKQDPKYSKEARIADLEGSVVLSVVIGSDGVASNIRVTRPLGLGLDDKAVDAVRGYRFQPSVRNGRRTPFLATVEIVFRSKSNERFWHLIRAAFTLPKGASRPVVTQAAYPPYGPPENATFTVSFDVDRTGTPTNFHLPASSNPDFDAEMTAFLKAWRFSPGVKAGIPIIVTCTLDLVWSTGETRPPGTSWTLGDAALRGEVETVFGLLTDGADPNRVDNQGYAALHQAALKGNTAVVKLLLEYGAKVNMRSGHGTVPLHEATLGGNVRTVRALLAWGANINANTTETQETSLHLAAALGRIEVIEALISAGARTDVKDIRGRTPRDEAIANDQHEAADALQNRFK